jgi:hypothetical protein
VVAVATEVQAAELGGGLADQVALGEKNLLSAVGLDVLTTFVTKRSQKLVPRRERFIHRRPSRERE